MTRFTGTLPNLPERVIQWLKQELPTTFVVRNKLPKDWKGLDVTVLVERAPGSGPSMLVETAAEVEVSIFTPADGTLDAEGAAIQAVEKAMAQAPAFLFDEVDYPSTFGERPYPNEKVRQVVGTYSITGRAR